MKKCVRIKNGDASITKLMKSSFRLDDRDDGGKCVKNVFFIHCLVSKLSAGGVFSRSLVIFQFGSKWL